MKIGVCLVKYTQEQPPTTRCPPFFWDDSSWSIEMFTYKSYVTMIMMHFYVMDNNILGLLLF